LLSPEHWVQDIQFSADLAAAYIILGLLLIAAELEDPFGDDITDIDMDKYIRQLKAELNILTSRSPTELQDFIANDENFAFGPMSNLPYSAIEKMSVAGMRQL
jgi:ion channel-forming bestrophin family protein